MILEEGDGLTLTTWCEEMAASLVRWASGTCLRLKLGPGLCRDAATGPGSVRDGTSRLRETRRVDLAVQSGCST